MVRDGLTGAGLARLDGLLELTVICPGARGREGEVILGVTGARGALDREHGGDDDSELAGAWCVTATEHMSLSRLHDE
jgi:hypothetical protein